MRQCNCEQPEPKPQNHSVCVKCSYVLPDTWGDEGVKEFYDALEAAHAGGPPPSFAYFRLEAEARERAGRRRFRFSFLQRDNIRDAFEEFSDGANYLLFRVWQNRRNGRDDQMDLALSAAYHAAKAYHFAAMMRDDERGRPHAISDSPEP